MKVKWYKIKRLHMSLSKSSQWVWCREGGEDSYEPLRPELGGGGRVPQVCWCSQVVTASLHQRALSGQWLSSPADGRWPLAGEALGRSHSSRSAGGGAPGPGAVRPSQHPGTGGPLDPDRQGRAQSWPSAHLANISQHRQNQTTDNYTGMWTKKVSFSNASRFVKGAEKTQRLRGSEIFSE